MVKNLYKKGLIFFTISITFLIFSSATAVQTVHASPTMNALEKLEKTKHFLDEKQHLFSNLNCDSKDSFKEILSKVKSLSENTNYESKMIISDMISLIEGKFGEKIPMDLNRDFNLWEILLAIFTAIIELADFLYSVIEPFIVIIFTILYAVNPPLAVLFIIFALILRILSMIDLEGNESYTNHPCSLLNGQ